MSNRPSTKKQQTCHNAHNSSNSYGYVIIGDTAASILYANRLLHNGVTGSIDILVQGMDRTNVNGLGNINYAVDNVRRSLQNLYPEQIHMIPNGDHSCLDDDDAAQDSQIVQYFVGSGIMGDFISSYFVPRQGPWYNNSTTSRLETFTKKQTSKIKLNSQENHVLDQLVNSFNLDEVCSSIIVNSPSILNSQLPFFEQPDCDFYRNLFFEIYNYVNQASNVNIYTEVQSIKFSKNGTGTYDVTAGYGLDGQTLTNRKIIWKTNVYSYLRIATNGGLNPKPVRVPTAYRAVLVIPKNNPSGVNLTNVTSTDNFITTYLAFSLYDNHNTRHSAMTWLIDCYTADEDASAVERSGSYSGTSNTLLMIDGINTKNRRVTEFNQGEQANDVFYNDNISEREWLRKFAVIVSKIYEAYTGATIDPDSLISEISVCSGTQAPCFDNYRITDVILREPPMLTAISTSIQLYGGDLYPNPGNC